MLYQTSSNSMNSWVKKGGKSHLADDAFDHAVAILAGRDVGDALFVESADEAFPETFEAFHEGIFLEVVDDAEIEESRSLDDPRLIGGLIPRVIAS